MGQQTSLKTAQDVAIEGAMVSLKNSDIESFVSEEASAEMPYGVMLKRGTAVDQALLCAAQVDKAKFLGVLVHSQLTSASTVGETGVKPNQAINVLRRGEVWVIPEEAVTPESDVRVRCVVAGAEVAGAFRVTADSTDTVDISLFARWRSVSGAGVLARLYIDMTAVNHAVSDT